MLPLPTKCPLCSGEIVVTKLICRECDTAIEGRFVTGQLARLSSEQLEFVEVFVRHEGKIKHMESELGLSYPTIRNRLHEVIRALGYQPGGNSLSGLSDLERKQILEELDAGRITTEEAMRMLSDEES